MDHLDAKRLHAAEKYVLGELAPEQRDAYEEHYFDCLECAEDVKAAAIFVSASREVLREESVAVSAPVRGKAPATPRRLAWLRPLIAVPALGVLILTIVYSSRQSKPQVGEITAPGQALVFSPSFGLRGGDRLENEKTVVQVRGSQAFQLRFDFLPAQNRVFDLYTGELQDKSGHALLEFKIPADRVSREVNLVVPAGLLRPGEYSLMLFGSDATPGSSAKQGLEKFIFIVENIP
jgi:hypothetical protein